jgi:hypothetical protein
MVPKQGHYIFQFLKQVQNEGIKPDDVKKELQSCRFTKDDCVKTLKELKEKHALLIQNLCERLHLQEGQDDQCISDLEHAIDTIPTLTSSNVTAKVLGLLVYEVGVIAKSILATRNKSFSRHSLVKTILEPFQIILEEAKRYALEEKRDYLKSCFIP